MYEEHLKFADKLHDQHLARVVRRVIWRCIRYVRMKDDMENIAWDMVSGAMICYLDGGSENDCIRASEKERYHTLHWKNVDGKRKPPKILCHLDPSITAVGPVECEAEKMERRREAARFMEMNFTNDQMIVLARSISTRSTLSYGNRGATKMKPETLQYLSEIVAVTGALEALQTLFQYLPNAPKAKQGAPQNLILKARAVLGFCIQCGDLPPPLEMYCNERCRLRRSRFMPTENKHKVICLK